MLSNRASRSHLKGFILLLLASMKIHIAESMPNNTNMAIPSSTSAGRIPNMTIE